MVRDQTVDDAMRHIGDIGIDIVEAGSMLSVKTVQPNSSSGRTYQVNYVSLEFPNCLQHQLTDQCYRDRWSRERYDQALVGQRHRAVDRFLASEKLPAPHVK